MASTSNQNHYKNNPNSSPNTTFVQADPSNFRAVVQKLTGANQSAQKLRITSPPRTTTPFKLHERRYSRHAPSPEPQEENTTARRLQEIKLDNKVTIVRPISYRSQRNFLGEMVMVSPVSPLELMNYEEERVIAEKGFYLHPTSVATPRGFGPPELLPLFPIHSPRN